MADSKLKVKNKKSKSEAPKYESSKIESKWQAKWAQEKTYQPDLYNAKRPFYNLMMFPYPSAEGMHVGNMYAFTGSDVYGRFKRMQGNDVFEPIGLDGFGIHSENYALKVGRHPKEQAKISQENFYRQMRAIGNGFAWDNKLETYDPDYYKWTQWIFIQLFKAGLAYRKKASVNFCPQDKTVLADEQVIAGCCERCGAEVVKKDLEQWFFKITNYAQRLLNNIEKLDWTEKVKIAQREWIGKKTGINITYKLEGNKEEIICFTTRPDTNFGATFIVLGPEHKLALKITTVDRQREVKEYINKSIKKSEVDRIAEGRKKTGVFTGAYAINNLNGRKMPIWISDFVLGNVGTGAVVGVPGHDRRDFEFAETFGIEIIRVVIAKDGDKSEITKLEQVQEKEGKMINSEFLDGLDIREATKKIMDYFEEKGWGKRVTTYHLRDWLISRQRYWGPPIPMINCEKCGWQPVPDEKLPILLPDVEDWKPKGDGQSPLANIESFVNTKCPNCGGPAKRETDVSDTFLDSAWYFFRYPAVENKEKGLDDGKIERWLPVDMYIGGAEHSVLHLLYSRFITMVFKDLKLIDFEEPFSKFRAHGLLIKEGAKMSKSKGNVVIPDEYIRKFGADTLRLYLMFLGPFKQGGDFYDTGIEGMYRFIKRVWVLANSRDLTDKTSEEGLKMTHKTIKKVTEDIEHLRYNTAIAALMEFYNFLSKQQSVSKEEVKTFILLISPFSPHVCEELWSLLGEKGSVHKASWPEFKTEHLKEKTTNVIVQVNGKTRDVLAVHSGEISDKQKIEDTAKASHKVQKHLNNRPIRNVVYVPGKILNFVLEDLPDGNG